MTPPFAQEARHLAAPWLAAVVAPAGKATTCGWLLTRFPPPPRLPCRRALAMSGTAIAAGLPCGMWREHTKKFSPQVRLLRVCLGFGVLVVSVLQRLTRQCGRTQVHAHCFEWCPTTAPGSCTAQSANRRAQARDTSAPGCPNGRPPALHPTVAPSLAAVAPGGARRHPVCGHVPFTDQCTAVFPACAAVVPGGPRRHPLCGHAAQGGAHAQVGHPAHPDWLQ